MPKRSKIDLLPNEVREELNQKLIDNAFGDYTGLTNWLNGKGYEVCRTTVNVYGKKLQARIEAIRLMRQQAQAISEGTGDEENSVADALSTLTQERLFTAILELEKPDLNIIQKAARAVAELSRSSIALKRYQKEVRDEKERVAKSVRQRTQKAGLSDEAIAEIEREILGIGG